ncbi:craniofacial development protein 2-like [Schistocerca gregaria]|uniref:craniofacial development protein 2-like n=1 Tax=Schistocerca gregaria TaxID=7010 RepID=UPI00211E9266|nr:craniofacial development protein 2-like [Schistocerca gregaria]
MMMASSWVKYSGGKIVPHSDLRAGTTQEDVVIRRKKTGILRIGAWNVRSLNRAGRLENLKREMDRLKLDIVGISEVRWQEEQEFWSGDYRVINTKSNRGNAGVALIMNRKIGMRVSYYKQHRERIIVAKIDTKPTRTTVVQVYMLTSSADDEEIEEMYDQIKEIIQIVKGDENLIVMGDWYSVVGKGREGNVVGEYELGQRNERGSHLVEFCTEHNLIIGNTWFKNHKRRLYAWKNPGDTKRYQIDYIMVRQRFRNQVLNCKTFPGADVDSDHNILVMTCRLKLKKLQKGGNLRRWVLDKLKEPEVVQSFRESIREQLTGMGERNTVEEEWVSLRDEVVKAAEDQVGKKTRASRNPWVTEETLNLIDERRKYKNAVI